jgi:hypothetical protein
MKMCVHTAQQHTDVVVNWCLKQGLKCDGSRRDVVIAAGSVATVERALKTNLRLFRKGETTRLRTLEWSLPDEVHQYVQLIAGLTELWEPKKLKFTPLEKTEDDRKRNDILTGSAV